MIARLAIVLGSLFAARCRAPDFHLRPEDADGPLSAPTNLPEYPGLDFLEWLAVGGVLILASLVVGLVNIVLGAIGRMIMPDLSEPFDSKAYDDALKQRATDGMTDGERR